MYPHIHATIGFDADTLGHEEDSLLMPSRHGASYAVDDTMARQVERLRGIVHRLSHQSGVVWPTYQLGYAPV